MTGQGHDPLILVRAWLAEATSTGGPLAAAMSLATASPDGVPSVRTVTLKGCDPDGFVFLTSLDTLKARHIATNPRVSLLFFWRTQHRQVRIDGHASPLAAAELPRFALACDPSGDRPVSPRERLAEAGRTLVRAVSDARRHVGRGQLPPRYGGFRVKPATIELWQGHGPGAADRVVFRLLAGGWQVVQ